MATAQIDQRIIERLVFAQLKTAESASLMPILLPGEQEPDAPETCYAQLLGVEFDYPDQGAGADGPDYCIVTALVVVASPPMVTDADAAQVQTATSAILAAMRRTSSSSGTHTVHIDTARTRLARGDDDLNSLRIKTIELRGTATRSSGTSLE